MLTQFFKQAFFTEIMKRIGVKGAKIEEVLSVDEFNLATLPYVHYINRVLIP